MLANKISDATQPPSVKYQDRREILRCVKRYIAREIFTLLRLQSSLNKIDQMGS